MSPADDPAAPAAGEMPPPFKTLPRKTRDVSVGTRADGTHDIRSNHPPGERPRLIAHRLAEKRYVNQRAKLERRQALVDDSTRIRPDRAW